MAGFWAWSPRGGDFYVDAAALNTAMGIVSGTTPAANGVTAVAVAAPSVTATSVITLSMKTPGGTPGGVYVSAITPGVGFSFKGVAGDTSLYTYEIRG